MNILIRPVCNQKGSLLVIALLLIATLTIIGIASISNSVNENMVAVNDQVHKMAFYNADSGVYSTPKIISASVDDGQAPDDSALGFNYHGTETDPNELKKDFYRKTMGFEDNDSGIEYSMGDDSVTVQVERIRAKQMAGGGAEFGSGAEGIGVGSTGSTAIYFTIISEGTGPRNSISTVVADYRKVVGSTGGL